MYQHNNQKIHPLSTDDIVKVAFLFLHSSFNDNEFITENVAKMRLFESSDCLFPL